MVKTEVKLIQGKSNKGNDFEALQFIVKTPVGNYVSGLNFPTPMELNIIKKYLNDENESPKSDLEAIYGVHSSESEGF